MRLILVGGRGTAIDAAVAMAGARGAAVRHLPTLEAARQVAVLLAPHQAQPSDDQAPLQGSSDDQS